jgi:hypothetical protein
MTKLFAPGFSVTRTKRRRLLWAAWWTGPPVREPFRKPDASSGGARSLDEARQEAEGAAARPLVQLEASWARAWGRLLQGQAAWTTSERARQPDRAPPRAARVDETLSVWALLGITSGASVAEVKAGYRRRALELHPDRGGDAAEFRALHAAYEEALRRIARKTGRKLARRASSR